MSTASFIERCIQAGMPFDMALTAAKAFEAELEAVMREGADAITKRRENDAARKRRQREREEASRSRDVTGDHGTSRDIPDTSPLARSLPPSPQTPLPPTHTHTPPDTSSRAREAADFAAFWAAYPRKVGKPKALLAYRVACRQIGGPDPPAVILAGLQAQLPGWALREPDRVPHPTTWLHRDGWEDQPDTIRPLRPAHDQPSRYDRKHEDYRRHLEDVGGAMAHAVQRRAGGAGGV